MSIIAYVPAYHRGYADFFRAHAGPLYVMSTTIARKLYPKIERDFRAVPAKNMVAALKGAGFDARLLSESRLKTITHERIIMPDEDLSHLFALKYLVGKDVTFVPTHLRWDGWSSVKETPVTPGRIVSSKARDIEMLKLAQDEAQRSPDWWRQVGAVLVKDNSILATGYNRPAITDGYTLNAFGDPRSNFNAGDSYDLTTAEHAEAHLIGCAAREGWKLKGAYMYVTTFPCPTCAKLIATAGIQKVFYAEGYSLVDAEKIFASNKIEVILVQ